ncbi:hypothetical protein LT493_30275 [Streptomyces tricolor]|nr:hypothetical protein [Streptomyces tricolor]
MLQRLTGLPERPGRQPLPVNWAMHFGQAALLGVLRSIMAQAGLRGPVASAKFAVVRLTNDQILENATGVGAPPTTWPPPGTRRGPAPQGRLRLRHRRRRRRPPPPAAAPAPDSATPPSAWVAAPATAPCPAGHAYGAGGRKVSGPGPRAARLVGYRARPAMPGLPTKRGGMPLTGRRPKNGD